MPAQDPPGGVCPPSHGLLPTGLDVGEFDHAEDVLDDLVEDLVLVGHVLVQRHRLHAESGTEAAHGQGVQTVSIGKIDRGADDAVLGQGLAGGGRVVCWHLDKSTK